MAESSREQAQIGFQMIKDAVMDILRTKDDGETDSEIGKALGLHHSKRKGHNGYVVWTALGHLMAEGKATYDEHSRKYRAVT